MEILWLALRGHRDRKSMTRSKEAFHVDQVLMYPCWIHSCTRLCRGRVRFYFECDVVKDTLGCCCSSLHGLQWRTTVYALESWIQKLKHSCIRFHNKIDYCGFRKEESVAHFLNNVNSWVRREGLTAKVLAGQACPRVSVTLTWPLSSLLLQLSGWLGLLWWGCPLWSRSFFKSCIFLFTVLTAASLQTIFTY